MTDFYALTHIPLPGELHGKDSESCARLLSERERLGIEDLFFAGGDRTKVEAGTTAVVTSHTLLDIKAASEYATFVEFALGLLALSGFHSVTSVAHFSSDACVLVLRPPNRETPDKQPTFGKSINGLAVSQWLRQFFIARRNTQDRMHITADRFVRYLRGSNSGDSLTDLCICLESLLDSQTEIKFRFGASLARVTGKRGTEADQAAELLEDLYDLRSKVVHGDPAATKLRQKMEAKLPTLRTLARAILTRYVLFMSEHSRPDWKKHLRTMLFD
jgi:hypothetical protein